MGKTFKDQRKYDKKQRERDDDFARTPRKNSRHRPYDEIIPDEDELDPYEALDYDDDYYR